MRFFLMAVAASMCLSAPAWAEGAFAIGACNSNGYPYGYSWNDASKAAARQIALAYCARHGGNCKIVDDDLNLLCFTFAVDKSRKCGPYGLAYYTNRVKSEQQAVAMCRGYGGKDCRIVLSQCDAGKPSTGGPIYTPPKFPLCYTGPTHEPRWHPWECPP